MSVQSDKIKTAAFTSIYESTHQKLYSILVHICYDKETAKDLLQKTYQVLWEKWETANTQQDLLPFLLTIAKNFFFDQLRRSNRYKQIINDITRQANTSAKAADHGYLRKECTETVTTLIDQLPPRRKQVAQLYLEDGLGRLEIAEIMGSSPNTVDVQLQKALKFLRGEMADYQHQLAD